MAVQEIGEAAEVEATPMPRATEAAAELVIAKVDVAVAEVVVAPEVDEVVSVVEVAVADEVASTNLLKAGLPHQPLPPQLLLEEIHEGSAWSELCALITLRCLNSSHLIHALDQKFLHLPNCFYVTSEGQQCHGIQFLD